MHQKFIIHPIFSLSQHESAIRTVDKNVLEEIRNFKKCLIRMFANQDKEVVFMETVIGLTKQQRHCLIECVPIPSQLAKQAPLYFKKVSYTNRQIILIVYLDISSLWVMHINYICMVHPAKLICASFLCVFFSLFFLMTATKSFYGCFIILGHDSILFLFCFPFFLYLVWWIAFLCASACFKRVFHLFFPKFL